MTYSNLSYELTKKLTKQENGIYFTPSDTIKKT